jgi:signal peptidase I
MTDNDTLAARRKAALRRLNHHDVARFLLGWVKVFLFSVGCFLVIRTFLVEAFKIPSGSMEHTLLVGDFLMVNKLAYGAEVPVAHSRFPSNREPKLGDVIVFKWPVDSTKYLVKRVVGTPGDTIGMRGGVLVRNGSAVREPYVERTDAAEDPSSSDFQWQRPYLVRGAIEAGSYLPSRDNWGPLIVPKGMFFALGDNRDDSSDSRYWGFVPEAAIRGSPLFVYFSIDPSPPSGSAWAARVRWSRLGEIIR